MPHARRRDDRRGPRTAEDRRGPPCQQPVEPHREGHAREPLPLGERHRRVDTHLGPHASIGHPHILVTTRTGYEDEIARGFDPRRDCVFDLYRIVGIDVVIDDDHLIEIFQSSKGRQHRVALEAVMLVNIGQRASASKPTTCSSGNDTTG